MKLATLRTMLRGAPLLVRALRSMREVQRTAFLAAAGRAGVLARLAQGPASRDELAAAAHVPAEGRAAFDAWLRAGATLGELARDGDRWRLRGRLARALSIPEHDSVLALFEQAATLHHRVLFEAPALLRSGRRLTLADQDDERTARVSRITEPLIHEAIDEVVPERGAVALLEVGCGDGSLVRHAAERNPALTALALELSPEVAERARGNFSAWGLGERVEVVARDVRALDAAARFDLVTLHQSVYYFPLAERVALFAKLRGAVRPGGRLLVTSICRGGSMLAAILDVWGSLTEGCGPVPDPDELAAQLREAGWGAVDARNLLPGDRFYRFVASAPAS